jgi:hypothetical protein
MKCSSITEWHVGDKGITKDGAIVTIKKVSLESRMVIIEERLEKQLYIPAHGEIEKITQ